MTVEALTIREARKSFAGKAALAGVSFAVPPGEVLALVGSNGAGKTTLIKGMLDFLRLDGGEIRLFGVASRLPEARERLAYLPERFLPPWFLSGGEFLAHMARLYGQEPDPARMRHEAEGLDLDPAALELPVRSFSKGMTQKLGLLAVLSSGRELLVLDEPMSGLDPRARVRLKKRLAALREEGRTLFFSTHMLADVEEIGDRMAILEAGRLLFLGTPQACRERYPAPTLEAAAIRCVEEESPQAARSPLA